jgi:hypothetical protein
MIERGMVETGEKEAKTPAKKKDIQVEETCPGGGSRPS